MRVVCDFDVLNADKPLRDIVAALGADWNSVESDWRTLHTAVTNASKSQPTKADVLAAIDEEFDNEPTLFVTPTVAKQARKHLKVQTGWARAKEAGKAAIPRGQASQAWERLDVQLRAIGLFVVPGGALESWVPTLGNTSGAWVSAVLDKHSDLAGDPVLSDVRAFIRDVTELPTGAEPEEPA